MNNGNARRSRADRNICPDWVIMFPHGIGPEPRGFHCPVEYPPLNCLL